MVTCVAFTYTVYKCSSVAVAKKTPQGLNLLTHSSEAEAAPGRRGFLWNQSQLASAVWWSWSACAGRAKGSPFQRAESDWQAHRHLHGAWSSPQREGGQGWVLSVPFWRKRTLHLSEIKNCRTLQLLWTSLGAGDGQALTFPTSVWSPWHAVLGNSCFSLSDSSCLTDTWQTYPKCALSAGWWWFFPKWSSKQFCSFGCSGSAHQGKLNL